MSGAIVGASGARERLNWTGNKREGRGEDCARGKVDYDRKLIDFGSLSLSLSPSLALFLYVTSHYWRQRWPDGTMR